VLQFRLRAVFAGSELRLVIALPVTAATAAPAPPAPPSPFVRLTFAPMVWLRLAEAVLFR